MGDKKGKCWARTGYSSRYRAFKPRRCSWTRKPLAIRIPTNRQAFICHNVYEPATIQGQGEVIIGEVPWSSGCVSNILNQRDSWYTKELQFLLSWNMKGFFFIIINVLKYTPFINLNSPHKLSKYLNNVVCMWKIHWNYQNVYFQIWGNVRAVSRSDAEHGGGRLGLGSILPLLWNN